MDDSKLGEAVRPYVERKMLGKKITPSFCSIDFSEQGTSEGLKVILVVVASLRKQPTNAHWFPGEMSSKKRAQNFHADDVSLPRTVGSVSEW